MYGVIALPAITTMIGVNSPQMSSISANGISRRTSYAARRTRWKSERLMACHFKACRNRVRLVLVVEVAGGAGGGEVGKYSERFSVRRSGFEALWL